MANLKRFATKKIIITTIALLAALGLVLYFVFRNSGSQYQFVSVTQGSITQVVSVTGNTTPVQSLDLAFQGNGTVATVNYNAGAHVSAGTVIASLDTNSLQAQLAQAQATVDEQNAQLANLQAGAQPADIQASEAALAGGQQTLANMYGSIDNTISTAYAQANDAVRTQLQSFFTNSESNAPQLVFSVNNSQTLNDVDAARLGASTELNAWQSELRDISPSSPSSTLTTYLQDAASHLATIKNFLILVSSALLQQANLSNATLAAYNAEATAALNEVNAATTNVTAAEQNIASQAITIQQLQAQLSLKLAGSTADQVAAQQAQVEQAQASMKNVQVQIDQASIVSPIAGVITVQNAKVGQIATAGETLVSIISDSNLEVDAYVPETDIGQVSVGNPVNMTFDAFPGETFAGKIFYIDPAETDLSGVVDYKVKASFNTPDPRMKSGLTANLDIQTQS